jgi:soluble lytic murein transglycosylase-like protein
LERLAQEAPSRNDRALVEYQLGLTLASLDRYEDALASFQRAKRGTGLRSNIIQHRIKTLRKLGRTEEAVALAKRIAGGSRKVKDHAAARIYLEDGLYEKARKLYRRYHRNARGSDSRWKLAWLDYRTGRFKGAARIFSGLLNSRNFRAHKVAYWLARAYQGQGLIEKAKQKFAAIYRADPMGYYGIQAANRILDTGDNSLYRKLTRASLEDLPSVAERKKRGASIRWRGADGSTSETSTSVRSNPEKLLAAAKQYGNAFPELWRAYDRYRMGLDDEARLELRTAKAELRRVHRGPARLLAKRHPSLFMDRRRHKRGLWGSRLNRPLKISWRERKLSERRIKAIKKLDRNFSDRLRELSVAIGDYYWTRKNAYSNHWRLLKGIPTSGNREIFKQAYPMVFESILRKDTANYALSPFLMASMARVESGFNELAVSSAGARGLLQVMPVTGNLIAARRGDSEFAAADLLDPRVSIDYGTWYMDQLLYKFAGQEPLAIISYNCGPHRVQAWLARRGKNAQLDEFIEEVPYREARRYVKRVLQYVGMYRRIYEDRSDLYVGQRLDTFFKSNINW